MPPDAEGRIRHPIGEKGGEYAWATNPANAVGIFCPSCGGGSEYDQICHRLCILCGEQFRVVLQSWRMRHFPHRPELGESVLPKPPKPPSPNSAEGILAAGAGNRAPATIATAAAVVAIDTAQGKDKANRKSLQSGSKVSKDEEKIRKEEALMAEWFKWKTIHAQDITGGDKPSEAGL